MSKTPRTDEIHFDNSLEEATRAVKFYVLCRELEIALSEGNAARRDLINDLYHSLAWAHRNLGSAPRLIPGQNDIYYQEWHAANDLLRQFRDAKGDQK